MEKSVEEDEATKKNIRSNYAILKWMINYSRFASKLLPKLEALRLSEEEKEPFIEMTVRCLHMLISKLNRVDQLHG